MNMNFTELPGPFASGVSWLVKPSVPWCAPSVGHLLCSPEGIQSSMNPAPPSHSERMCGGTIHVSDERGK